VVFSRLLLGEEASQNAYASCRNEVDVLKARRGLLCTVEIGNICQASSTFKNWVRRLQTRRGIPQRAAVPESNSENRKCFHWGGVRANQLASL